MWRQGPPWYKGLYCKPIDQQGDVMRSARVPLLSPCRYAREKLSVRESDRRCPPLAFCPNVFPSVEPTTIVNVCIQIRRFRTKTDISKKYIACFMSKHMSERTEHVPMFRPIVQYFTPGMYVVAWGGLFLFSVHSFMAVFQLFVFCLFDDCINYFVRRPTTCLLNPVSASWIPAGAPRFCSCWSFGWYRPLCFSIDINIKTIPAFTGRTVEL